MASIDPTTLTAALKDAQQISTASFDGWTDPPYIVASAGVEGAGAYVAIAHGEADALDIQGQLAGRRWRIVAGSQVAATQTLAAYVSASWVRT